MAYPTNYNLMNPQQQYMNYFTQPMQQQIQQQMPMQSSMLSGKMIDGIDTVRVIDIPMDGNVHYFPKADGTEIYTKRWLPNGTTEITSYSKVENKPEEEVKQFDFELMENSIIEKLTGIEDRIVKLEKGLNNRATKSKEV